MQLNFRENIDAYKNLKTTWYEIYENTRIFKFPSNFITIKKLSKEKYVKYEK